MSADQPGKGNDSGGTHAAPTATRYVPAVALHVLPGQRFGFNVAQAFAVVGTLASLLSLWPKDRPFAQFMRERIDSDELYAACVAACESGMIEHDWVSWGTFERIDARGESLIRTLVLSAIREIAGDMGAVVPNF